MENCKLCNVELKFLNTPNFGSGKLSDGGVVCSNCFKKINKTNPKVAFKLKNFSIEQIKEILNDKDTSESLKNSRLDEIKSQIQNLKIDKVSSFLGRKEINELPNILSENEIVDNLIQGTFNNGQGILVSTNRRLIFIDKGLIYGLKVEDFPIDKITSIQYETGLLVGKVKIHTSGNIASIENVEKLSSRSFAEFIREKISRLNETTISIVNPKSEILEQLEKLAKLKEIGVLTEEEFQIQKQKFLDQL